MSTKLTPNQIKSLKRGDRVRISVEGEVMSADTYCAIVRFDGANARSKA